MWLLFRISFVTLPYLFYVSFVGLFIVMVVERVRHRHTALDPLTRNSLAMIGALLIFGSCFAQNRAEAFLQLVNFLPFFLFFSVLPFVMKGCDRLRTLATDWVIAAIPMSFWALGEYILKSPWIPRAIRRIPDVRALRNGPHKGRAMLMFTHPNSLANYLVVILGLGLGLILDDVARGDFSRGKVRRGLLYGGTLLTLVGIFCAGSRNGLVVAIAQMIVFFLCIKTNRRILLMGLLSLLGLVGGAAGLGLGRRSLAIGDWSDDPRWRVWDIAWDLVKERPGLGWGLGNYKFEFLPRLLVAYPECAAERTLKVIPVACADVSHPHNFWLLLGSEAGIFVLVGLSLWVGILLWRGVRAVWLMPHPDRWVLVAYLLGFGGCVGFALFDITFYDVRINALNWGVLAGIYGLSKSARTAPIARRCSSS
jgi:O-antigen ligase